MIICTCKNCRFTFRYPILPLACPDCGKKSVRPSNDPEIKAYHKEQAIIEQEIRDGLYDVATA